MAIGGLSMAVIYSLMPAERSPMVATTGDGCADCGRAGRRTDGAGVHHLAAGNGDVDWEFLEPCGRKGQWIITERV